MKTTIFLRTVSTPRLAAIAVAVAVLAACPLPGASPAAPQGLAVTGLRCEYLEDPLGIDTTEPRLSWRVESEKRGQVQGAYRILVASTAENLEADKGDLWDTGKVLSARTTQIVYHGRRLQPRQRCHWKVIAWSGSGVEARSAPAVWEMGYLSPDQWQGRWIGRTQEKAYTPAPYLRREFHAAGNVRRARLYVCGLGYHEVRVNGRKVGDHRLDPGYTRFDKRVLYVTHDVTDLVREGDNAVGVILGTGWYNVHTKAVWYFHKAPWRAAPKLLLDLRIEYEDGHEQVVASGPGWKTSTGPILYDSIYGGETYDARLELPGWDLPGFDDSAWDPAIHVDPPGGILAAQQMPSIKVCRVLRPARILEPKPGVFVVDMGQNLSGAAHLVLSGAAGTRIVMKYAEKLHPDGTVDQSNIAQHMDKKTPQRFQTDMYVFKGKGTEEWEARFVYHGFQYVEVRGAPCRITRANVCAKVLHSAVEPAGRFECSNPLLNKIWECTRWAYLSNLQGIPTDCPHREKNGWTGDAHLAAEQGMYNFDPAGVYTKWINDLDDEQRKADEGKLLEGELPGIVPTSGWGYEWGNGPAWDSAFLLIPWYMYQYYGDTRILTRHYEGFKLYVDYLTRRSEGGLVSIGLGDWCPYKAKAPAVVTSTAYYYRDALIVARTAEMLGKQDEARRYAKLAARIRKAFNEKFHDAAKGSYADGSQTSLACALYQGLAREADRAAVVRSLVDNIHRSDDHLDFGILGSKYVLNALTDGGRCDVAYRIASRKTYPSWGNWIERGATTLWESWDGKASRNHIMFGEISAWFFRALAGIRGDPEAPGFERVVIQPHPVGDLQWVRARYDSIRGPISSEWENREGFFRLRVAVPANVSAVVHLPASKDDVLTEGRKPMAEAEGVKLLGRTESEAVLEIGSGKYVFTAQ